MSEESYHLHNTAPVRAICNINVKTASGTDLEPLGIAECNFKLGTTTYVQPFIVCRKLTRNFILGRDFLRTNRLHVGWSNEGRFRVQSGKEVLIEAISVETKPVVTMKKNITVPPRTLVVVEMQTVIPNLEGVGYYDFMPTERYVNQEVNLVLILVAYYTTTAGKQQILQVIINLEEVPIKVSEGTVMGHLQDLKEVAKSIQTPSTHESICEIQVSPEEQDFLQEIMHDESKEEKKFITSPADIDTYRETKLKDAELPEKDRKKFEALCIQYDVFSKDSTDLGRSPLLTMEIDTGDHPPITQRPYSLALKHVEWVQEEIEKLEHAGVITRSM